MSGGDDSGKRANFQEEARKALESLSENEKKLLRKRFGVDIDSLSLEQIAEQFDSMRERIKQVELKALERLRKRKDPEDPA